VEILQMNLQSSKHRLIKPFLETSFCSKLIRYGLKGEISDGMSERFPTKQPSTPSNSSNRAFSTTNL